MALTDELYAAAEPLWRAQLQHPFVRGLGDGSLDEERRGAVLDLLRQLADREALDTYAAHPEHVVVLDFIRSCVTRSAAVDFIS